MRGSGWLMSDPSPLTRAVHGQLATLINASPSPEGLNTALRLLAKWRSTVIGNTLVARLGTTITHGPFTGMSYATPASEGSFPARLLGVYEASLAPVIEEIIARAYPLVIDVGCAEGYYAVGLARRMPGSTIWARDASDKAQVLCRDLARQNEVEVHVGGLLTHPDLAICADQPTVIICDIEGAEGTLLDPIAAPALTRADILVEVHEGMAPGLMASLTGRFDATHAITPIGRKLDDTGLPDWTEGWSDMDRLLALWEWRSGPTPWLWMQAKPRDEG
jgi:hypothetical protein